MLSYYNYRNNETGYYKKVVQNGFVMVADKFLKKNGIDAHVLKEEFIGKTNITHYDIYLDKDTGILWIFRKGGKGEPIPTYEYIKNK